MNDLFKINSSKSIFDLFSLVYFIIYFFYVYLFYNIFFWVILYLKSATHKPFLISLYSFWLWIRVFPSLCNTLIVGICDYE